MSSLRRSTRLSTKVTVSTIKESSKVIKKPTKSVTKRIPKQKQATTEVIEKKETKIESTTTQRVSRSYEVLTAANHLKKVDLKLKEILTDEAIDEFQSRVIKAGNAFPFRDLARAIIYQQISGKAASSIMAKFLTSFGDDNKGTEGWFPTPEQVLKKTVEEMRAAGLSARKGEYIRDLADKFHSKQVDPTKFDSMTDTEISKELCSIKGIGQWTVDMFLMFNLQHPDVLPVTDLGVRKGVALHFGLPSSTANKGKQLPSPEKMEEVTEIWKPYRTMGSWLMWRSLDIKISADE